MWWPRYRMKSGSPIARRRRGTVLVTTAFTLSLMVTLGALVADIGRVYVAQSLADRAARIAAESGALRWPDTVAGAALADREARYVAERDGLAEAVDVRSSWAGSDLSVSVRIESATLLLRLAGNDAFTVRATAEAAP